MAIKEKLDDGDLALVEVLEDPVWFAEFLRSTRDGSASKAAWGGDFQYRWYQRDLMTDQNPYIVLTGGRAVGKCQPRNARLLTTEGYKTIHKLLQANEHGVCELYCIDHATGNFTTSRATIVKDKWTRIYKVTTEAGHFIKASGNHPVLTQFGYKMVDDLVVGEDRAVVTTQLPWFSQQNLWRSPELRFLGYRFFDTKWYPEIPFKGRFKAIEQDYKKIAEDLGMVWAYENGGVAIRRPSATLAKHAITYATVQLGWDRTMRASNIDQWPRLVPYTLRTERRENIQLFLECVVAQYATFSREEVSLHCGHAKTAQTLQEMFLKCGVEMRIDGNVLRTATKTALYRLYTNWSIPGVEANITDPKESQRTEDTRFDTITSIDVVSDRGITYAVYVYDHHNYISDNICVHNSLVLEDKQLYDIVNHDIQLPQTKETLLTTTNKAQLEPIYGRVISRSTVSPLIRDFLQNRVNRTDGVMDFRIDGVQVLHRARIAGNKENNVVGLHVPRIIIDEGQLYMSTAYTQLLPTLNQWENKIQLFIAGVPNGYRNSALYITSVKTPRYKWYRVPSPNNPYFSKEDYFDALRRYGGEDSDEFQQLVLGKHGTAALSVINRDQITQLPYEFYSYRFQDADNARGNSYKTILDRPLFTDYDIVVAGIDTGYTDPTIISIVGRKKGIWHYLARYKLQRVLFPEQEEIIDWLDDFYKFDKIAIDAGSGGGGTQIMQSFYYRPEYQHKNYRNRVIPVQFGEKVPIGYSTEGHELGMTAKAYGAQSLVMMLQQSTFVLSEIDNEAVSQLERITKQRTSLGDDQYFIMSDKGNGKALDDHIFASLICFTMAVRDTSFLKRKQKRLGRASGK